MAEQEVASGLDAAFAEIDAQESGAVESTEALENSSGTDVETSADGQTEQLEDGTEQASEDDANYLPSEQEKVFSEEAYAKYAKRYGYTQEDLAADPRLKRTLHDKINSDILLKQRQDAEALQGDEADEEAATDDKTAWKRYTDAMISHAGAAGIYIGDEDVLGSFATSWYMGNYLAGVANALPSVGVLQYDSGMSLYRDVVDVPVHDPYGYALASSPDERIYGPTTNNCVAYTSANDNATHSITTCFPNRVDIWGNDAALNTYGSRPAWTVVQNFFRSSTGLYPYAELWKQYVKAYVACANLGNRGCGVLLWGSVSSSGMEDAYYTRGNTSAWQEQVNANNHFVDLLSHTFTQPITDSTYLGKTTYLTATTVNGSTWAAYGSKSSVCPSGASVNGYQDSSAWPDGPVIILAVKEPSTGDVYYYWTNLCSAAFTFQMTLGAGVSSAQTKVEVEDETGRRSPLTISAGTVTDTWNGFGAGVYIVRAPNGQLIGGKVTMN